MAFNATFLRQQRMQKNNAARVNKPRTFDNAPFLEPSELMDGTYNFRLWPSDPTKNPMGYLYQRTHTIMDATRKLTQWTCPRSNNWDPMPYGWEVPDPSTPGGYRTSYEMPDEDDYAKAFPLYKERCWGCETEAQIADLGIDIEKQLPVEVQAWLFGTSQPWREGLFGGEKYYFPCTFAAEVYGREEVVRDDGSKRTNTTYAPAPSSQFHCLFVMRESKMKDELLRLIEECPDCSNMMLGRWFRLEKNNGGKGVGGYNLSINPKPSSAGFELPSALYPNFANWGKGNAQYGKPSKRVPYATIEALGSDPQGFWCDPLRRLGVTMADDEANDIPF